MKREITPDQWEEYLTELNNLEEKYLADRDAIRNKLRAKQRALAEAEEK